jgi:hypothetical protein
MAFFLISSAGITAQAQRPFDRQVVEFEPDNGKSYLGTPVYSYIEFPEGSYETLIGERIDFDGVRVNEVLLEVSMAKNIITTAIQGRNGTIKEYVSDGDYNISVTGRLVNEKNAVPEIALNALKEICKVPDTLAVNCPFLQYFDITACVITDYSFTEIEGSRNQIDFSLSLLSDTPKLIIDLTNQEKAQTDNTEDQSPPVIFTTAKQENENPGI